MGVCQVLVIVTLVCILQVIQYECRAIKASERSRVQRSATPHLSSSRQRREAYEHGQRQHGSYHPYHDNTNPHQGKYVPPKVIIKVPLYGSHHRISSIVIDTTKPYATSPIIGSDTMPAVGGDLSPDVNGSKDVAADGTGSNIVPNETIAESDTLVDTIVTTTQVETIAVSAANSETNGFSVNGDKNTSTGNNSSSSATAGSIVELDEITVTAQTVVETGAGAKSSAEASSEYSALVVDQISESASSAGSKSDDANDDPTLAASGVIANAGSVTLTDTSKMIAQIETLSESGAESQSAAGNIGAQSKADAETLTDSHVSTTNTLTLSATDAAAEGNGVSAEAVAVAAANGGDAKSSASSAASGDNAMAEAASLTLSDTSTTNSETLSLSASQANAEGDNASATADAESSTGAGEESGSEASATASGTNPMTKSETETLSDTTTTNSETESGSAAEAVAQDGGSVDSTAAEETSKEDMSKPLPDTDAASKTETEVKADAIADTSALGTEQDLSSDAGSEGTAIDADSSDSDISNTDSNASAIVNQEAGMPTETGATKTDVEDTMASSNNGESAADTMP